MAVRRTGENEERDVIGCRVERAHPMKSCVRSSSPNPRNTGTVMAAFSRSVEPGSIEVRPQEKRRSACWDMKALRTGSGRSGGRNEPGGGRDAVGAWGAANRVRANLTTSSSVVFPSRTIAKLMFGQDSGKADPMAKYCYRRERGVPGLLNPEQHATHRMPRADGHQVWERRQAWHQGAGHEFPGDGAVRVVIDRADQAGCDEEDVIDRRGGADAEVIERDHDESPRGQVVGHAVIGVPLDLQIEVPGGALAAGEAAQEDRRR